MRYRAKRHRFQGGTTLVELLVSVLIIGTALVLLVGMFSTGAIDSRLAASFTAAQAAMAYEVEKVGAMPYANPNGYSECFSSSGAPVGQCSGSAGVRADVSYSPQSATLQKWTIRISSWPDQALIGTPVSIYKVNR
jgi:Tfp pilus assembly protein PilV